MKVTAEQKYIRMSPRKIRLVADVIRGLAPEVAIDQLQYVPKRAALPLSKVIRQALANATNNFKLNPANLRIAEVMVNEGATYKRWQPVSRGRAHSILKRSSHVKVILESTTVRSATVAASKIKPVESMVKSETSGKAGDATSATKELKPSKKSASKKTNTKSME